MIHLTLSEMIKAGVHFGHQTKNWNPKAAPYIYTKKKGVHIIDLIQTILQLQKVCAFLEKNAQKSILFIGTKKQAIDSVAIEAMNADCHYVNYRWLGGMLTNWTTMSHQMKKLNQLEASYKKGYFNHLPKKEGILLTRQYTKLKNHLSGIQYMSGPPDIAIVVDQNYEMNAIKECQMLQIPIISFLDTNCNPENATFFIPANDDSIRSIRFILSKLSSAIRAGKERKNNM